MNSIEVPRFLAQSSVASTRQRSDREELIGIVAIKRATRGVLVATSSVTGAGRDIAAHCARIEIIDGQRLKTMLREHLGLDAVITPPSD